jgi:hypothetical protein
MPVTLGQQLEVRKGDLMISVKDYGAKGDGVADDTAAIQAAENARAALPTGGILYFPPGAYKVTPGPVTRIAIIVSGTNFEVRGAGEDKSNVNMADNVGDYLAMFATLSNPTVTSGMSFRDITLNGNSANNVITDIAPLFANKPRYAIRHFSGQRVRVKDCRFTSWDNINTVAVNSSNAADVTIQNCLFDDTGAHSPYHDHSSVYISAERMEVTGCTFIGTGISATTAIETHGGAQNIHHNRVTAFFAGANITGVAASSKHVVVDHNVMKRVGIGVELWAWAYAGNNTPWGLEHCKVADNSIEIDYDLWSFLASWKVGIGLDPNSSLGIRDVQIIDNTVVYLPFTGTPAASDNVSSGIRLSRSPAYAGVDQDVTIAGNRIEGSIGPGIYVNTKGTSLDRLTIRHNAIVNPGQGNAAAFSNSFKVGIFLNGVLNDCRLLGNMTVDDRGTAVITAGITTQFVTAANGYCEALDNVLRVADAAATVPPWLGSATPAPFHLRERHAKLVLPTAATLAGSTVRDPNGILYTQTTAPSGTGWAAAAANPAYETNLLTTGRYYTPGGTRSTLPGASVTNGQEYAASIWIGSSGSITRIGAEVVTTAGSTGSVVRLGIRADNGSGLPGTLLVEAGTIDSTATGVAEITLGTPLAVTPGLYWLCAAYQGAPTTQPTLRALTGTRTPVGAGSLSSALGTATMNGYIQTGVTGALPGTFTVANQTGLAPVLAIRNG